MSGAGTMKPLFEAEARERRLAGLKMWTRFPSSSMEENGGSKGYAEDLVGAKFGVSGKARGLIHVAELIARDPLVARAVR